MSIAISDSVFYDTEVVLLLGEYPVLIIILIGLGLSILFAILDFKSGNKLGGIGFTLVAFSYFFHSILALLLFVAGLVFVFAGFRRIQSAKRDQDGPRDQ